LSLPTRLPLKSEIENINSTVTNIQSDVTAIGVTVTAIGVTVTAIENYVDQVPQVRIETAQIPAAENAAVAIATTDETSLGAKTITVSIPTGSTILSVIAMAKINVMNDAAQAQKIDLKMKVEGVTLFNQANIVGFPAADGASAVYVIAEDASDEVTTIGQVVDLEALATLSAAASVRFQCQYLLFVTYRVG